MSFDIFLQAFRDGQASHHDPAAVRRMLTPFLSAPPSDSFARVVTADGEADVHGIGDPSGLMFNHVEGERAWQLIYEVAREAGLVIMPVGCATLICSAAGKGDLPEELRADVRVVHSGADLLRAIGEV